MATDGLSPRNRLFLRAGAVLAGVLAIVVGAVLWQGYRRQHAEVCPFSPVFDRCEPSILAFGRREQAEEFARSNGGAVRRLPEILQEAGVRP